MSDNIITMYCMGIIVIMIICIFLSNTSYTSNKCGCTREHLINLDDSRKNNLKKCCDDNKCYDKPPFLQKDECSKNEKNKTIFNKIFDTMFSTEKYNKLLKSMNIKSLTAKDINISDNMIDISKKLGPELYNKILNDTSYSVKGVTQ